MVEMGLHNLLILISFLLFILIKLFIFLILFSFTFYFTLFENHWPIQYSKITCGIMYVMKNNVVYGTNKDFLINMKWFLNPCYF